MKISAPTSSTTKSFGILIFSSHEKTLTIRIHVPTKRSVSIWAMILSDKELVFQEILVLMFSLEIPIECQSACAIK